jgi:hypothetical protein
MRMFAHPIPFVLSSSSEKKKRSSALPQSYLLFPSHIPSIARETKIARKNARRTEKREDRREARPRTKRGKRRRRRKGKATRLKTPKNTIQVQMTSSRTISKGGSQYYTRTYYAEKLHTSTLSLSLNKLMQ